MLCTRLTLTPADYKFAAFVCNSLEILSPQRSLNAGLSRQENKELMVPPTASDEDLPCLQRTVLGRKKSELGVRSLLIKLASPRKEAPFAGLPSPSHRHRYWTDQMFEFLTVIVTMNGREVCAFALVYCR